MQANDLDAEKLTEEQKYDILAEFDRDDYNETKNLLDEVETKYGVLVTGTLDLWFGKREIEPVVFDYITDLLDHLARNGDTYDLEIRAYKGYIEVVKIHHDGTNVFKVVQLTEKGWNEQDEADLTKEGYTEGITYFDYMFPQTFGKLK